MSDVTLNMDDEFTRIKLTRLETRDRWKVLREECPVRVKGRVSKVPWSELPRCASGISNLEADRSSMEYCLYGYCPKIT